MSGMSSRYEWVERVDDAGSVGLVQRALEFEGLAEGRQADPVEGKQLGLLAERLKRVQALGGAYAAVDFAPTVKAMLDQQDQAVSEPVCMQKASA